MTSTIKMNNEIKRRFDQLQAKILIETGKKLSQQELLELLLKEAEKKEEFVQKILSLQMPLSKEKRRKFRNLQADFGFNSATIDEDSVIYEFEGK